MLAGKRVLIVLPGLELAGAERQALLLARHLIHCEGAQVQVWGLNSPGRVIEICKANGIPCQLVRMPWSRDRMMRCKAWARFTLALRQARPNIILPYSMRPNVICGMVWRLTGAQLCIWNQRDEGRSDRVGRRFQRWTARQMPCFISNSRHGKDFLIEALRVKPQQIHVIDNGVALSPPAANRETWRNRLGVNEDCFLVCMVANLHKFKDHATLLKAWPKVANQLREKNRTAVLLLAGELGETYQSLQSLACNLALGKSVRFLGKVDDISGLLHAVNLGVFSSRYEGVPNGLLECMAAGLAVAGTNSSGICEAVGPNGYGYLAPPGDAEALAQRILLLAQNPKLRMEAGDKNRHRIELEFSSQRMCEATIAVIKRGLSNK